jgi:hypothetical protein
MGRDHCRSADIKLQRKWLNGMTKLSRKASKRLRADPDVPIRSRDRKRRDPAQPQLPLDPMPARIEPALALVKSKRHEAISGSMRSNEMGIV